MRRIKISPGQAEKLRKRLNSRGLDRRPQIHRDPHPQVIVENRSEDETKIPPYALMQPIDCWYENNRFIVRVKKWDGTYFGEMFFNSHNWIDHKKRGVIQRGPIYTAYFDQGDGTGFYSPVKDEWYIVPGDGPFEALGIGKRGDELYCLYPNPPELVRFILKENCLLCDTAEARVISPIDCLEGELIQVVDTIGVCAIGYDGDDGIIAPIDSMGFARRIAVDVFEIVNIARGCCEEITGCPQIPGVPMGAIGVDGVNIKWVLGYDENGCLVRVPVGDCCTEEEEEPPPAQEKPPE